MLPSIFKNNYSLKVNREKLFSKLNTLQKNYEELLSEIEILTGIQGFNPNSRKHKKFLFDSLGIHSDKRTEGGEESFSKDVLEKYLNYKEIQVLYDLVTVSKKISSVKSFIKFINNLDEFKFEWNIRYGVSRVFAKSPSFSIFIKEIRECLEPYSGYKFLYFDFKTLELYVASVLSNENYLKSNYEAGKDLHLEVAKLFFENSYEDKRELIKTLNFSILYGSQGNILIQKFGISINEAQSLVNKFWNFFGNIENFKNKVIDEFRRTKRIKTLKNHYFYGNVVFVDESELERFVFNSVIQSSSAELSYEIISSLVSRYNSDEVKFLTSIFDSCLLEVREDLYEKVLNDLYSICENFSLGGYNFKMRFEVKDFN